MKSVLLINLPIKMQFKKFLKDEVEYNPSLGLLAIASFLNMHGYQVTIKDYNYEMYSNDTVLNEIEKTSPLLVGITVFTENVQEVLFLSKQIKRLVSGTMIVAGGPHATLKPEDLINSKYIDFVSMKEGESVFLELLEYLGKETQNTGISLSQIDGLVYRENRKIQKNSHRKYITDLDLLPMINRSLLYNPVYSGTVNLSTSRGCPAKCIYCAATALSGASYRVRNIRNVFQEILLIHNDFGNRVKRYYFVDDTFTVNINRITDFINLRKQADCKWNWACESRIDVMSEELLKEMYENGCNSVQFGVESGNQAVLDQIRKAVDLNQIRRIVNYGAMFHMEICLSFMFGHYCDTIDTMEDTVKFIKEMKENNPNVKLGIGYNTPLPGTWQYTRASEIGLTILTADYSKYDLVTPIIEGKGFKKEDLEAVYYRAGEYMVI